jgi:hypothetical protein
VNEHRIAFPAHTYRNYLILKYSSKLAVKLLIEICDRRSKAREYVSLKRAITKEKVPKCGNRVLKTTSP